MVAHSMQKIGYSHELAWSCNQHIFRYCTLVHYSLRMLTPYTFFTHCALSNPSTCSSNSRYLLTCGPNSYCFVVWSGNNDRTVFTYCYRVDVSCMPFKWSTNCFSCYSVPSSYYFVLWPTYKHTTVASISGTYDSFPISLKSFTNRPTILCGPHSYGMIPWAWGFVESSAKPF